MQEREYTLLTDDWDFIMSLVHKGNLIELSRVFDFGTLSFTYKIKYV
jgi:hypothetical protein